MKDFSRLFDLLPYQLTKYSKEIALAQKIDGHWQQFSTQHCIDQIDLASSALLYLNIEPNEKVAILTVAGSPYWNFWDMGILQIGAITVPIHATATDEQIVFIINEAKIRFCFCDDEVQKDRLDQLKPLIPSFVTTYDLIQGTLEILPADKPTLQPEANQLIEQRKRHITPKDLATIIYTSGTTGDPKGVMLSHDNIISNIKATLALVPFDHTKKTFSFLPLSHIFERMVTFSYIASGCSLYYIEKGGDFIQNLQEVRPNYFTSVPRLLEKLYDGILEEAASRKGLGNWLIKWAIRIGEKPGFQRNPNFILWLQRMFADLLVYRRWRQRLGGKVEGISVGAAALQPRLGQLFSSARIPIREGYGLTESSPVISFNRFEPGGNQYGTVGIPIPGVNLKIDQPDESGEGEIIVNGPNIMMGYYQKPEQTKATFTEDGWLRTGDMGKIVNKRFLQITGRKKDLFKTTSGKFIAPAYIEQLLKASEFIEQCLIAGANKPFVVALIIPSFAALKEWALLNQIHWTAPQYMVLNPKIIKHLANEIDKINLNLPNYQKIKKFYLLHEEWTPGKGELTPTFKMRRRVILSNYEKQLNELYQNPKK